MMIVQRSHPGRAHTHKGFAMSTPTTPAKPTNGLAAARKAKKYGHVSLAYALWAADKRSTVTAADIASLEATGTAKDVSALIKAVSALPTKPGRFWDILEGRIAPPVDAVKVFANKRPGGKGGPVAPVKPAAASADLI